MRSFDPPKLRDDLPRYPPLLQLLRITSATVPGPFGYGSSSVLGPLLYVGATQQLRTDTILPRDREPCLCLDVNGFGLASGYYLGRLAGSYSNLPVYEVGGASGSVSVSLPGLTIDQLSLIATNLSLPQINALNNLNACQLQILLTQSVAQIQRLTGSLTATQLTNLVDALTSTQLTNLVNTLTLNQLQTFTSTLTANQVQLLTQSLTAGQIQTLINGLTPTELQNLTKYPSATIPSLVNGLSLPNLATLLDTTPTDPIIGTQTFPPEVPLIIGKPSSIPNPILGGYAPVVVDKNGILWSYYNGMWNSLSGGGGGTTPTGVPRAQHVGTTDLDQRYVAGYEGRTGLLSSSMTADTLFAIPFIQPGDGTLDRLEFYVQSAGGGSAKARVGIYSTVSGTDLYPGTLLVDGGEFNCSGTGLKSATISKSIPAGVYWAVYLGNDSGISINTLGSASGSNSNIANILGLTNSSWSIGAGASEDGLSTAHAYSSLPGTFPSSVALSSITSPAVAMRFSA